MSVIIGTALIVGWIWLITKICLSPTFAPESVKAYFRGHR